MNLKIGVITLVSTSPESFWTNFYERSLSFFSYRRACYKLFLLLSGHPLPYITGRARFFGLTFFVRPGIFIPQSDSELLVDAVISHSNDSRPLRVVDVGTGCGALAICLAKLRPSWSVFALDSSKKALSIAKKNAFKHKVKVKFFCSDLLGSFKEKKPFDVIVSNPPYIDKRHYDFLSPLVRTQPHWALFAPEGGLFFYKCILNHATSTLVSGGLLAMEVDPTILESLLLMIKTFPFLENKPEVIVDYNGNSRVLLVRKRVENKVI